MSWSTGSVRANLTSTRGHQYDESEAGTFLAKESQSFGRAVQAREYCLPIMSYGVTRKILSPMVSENVELNHLVFSLLQRGNLSLKGLVYGYFLGNSDFKRLGEQVNMYPFINLGSSQKVDEFAPEEIHAKDLRGKYGDIFSDIIKGKMLGRNTASKFGSLRQINTARNLDNNLRQLIYHISFRLDRGGDPNDQLRGIFNRAIALLKNSELLSNADHLNSVSIYIDDLIAALGYSQSFMLENRVFSVAFAPRDSSYLTLGNQYGDCTSIQKEFQEDDVKNIFWTKASWILDPFYQILEIRENGEPLIKFHLILTQISGKICLVVDAIETSVSMREFLGNSGSISGVNTNKNTAFPFRFNIMERGFGIVREIAQKMGVETILVEEYSNTSWVRDAISNLPEVHFYLHNVSSIYDGEAIDSLYQNLTGRLLGKKQSEIQILNTQLQDKGLRGNINSARVLQGKIQSINNPYRGI